MAMINNYIAKYPTSIEIKEKNCEKQRLLRITVDSKIVLGS